MTVKGSYFCSGIIWSTSGGKVGKDGGEVLRLIPRLNFEREFRPKKKKISFEVFLK